MQQQAAPAAAPPVLLLLLLLLLGITSISASSSIGDSSPVHRHPRLLDDEPAIIHKDPCGFSHTLPAPLSGSPADDASAALLQAGVEQQIAGRIHAIRAAAAASGGVASAAAAASAEPLATIPVHVYVLLGNTTSADGTAEGDISDAVIQELMNEMNKAFAVVPFRFELASLDRKVNPGFYRRNRPSNALDLPTIQAVHRGGTDSTHIHLYSYQAEAPGFAGNLVANSYLPTHTILTPGNFEYDGVFIDFNYVKLPLPSPFKVVIHEVGHLLNLLHPYSGEAFTSDTYQSTCDNVDNDFVDDTPVSAVPAWDWLYPDVCNKERDTCTGPRFPGKDPVDNLMDASYACTFEQTFTPGQVERMKVSWQLIRALGYTSSDNKTAAEPRGCVDAPNQLTQDYSLSPPGFGPPKELLDPSLSTDWSSCKGPVPHGTVCSAKCSGPDYTGQVTAKCQDSVWLVTGECKRISKPRNLECRVRGLSLGSRHNLVVMDNGEVRGWGENDGTAATGVPWANFKSPTWRVVSRVQVPDTVPGLESTNIISASASSGFRQSCVTTFDRRVICFGDNTLGQSSADGKPTSSPLLASASTAWPGIANVRSVGTGNTYSCALLMNGTVVCVGEGSKGELGDGRAASSATPVQVLLPGRAVQLSVGWAASIVLLENGDVYRWGSNNFHGACAPGDTSFLPAPVKLNGLSKPVKQVAYGLMPLMTILFEDGTLASCGDNYYGGLGPGAGAAPESVELVPMEGISDIVQVDLGYHTIALKQDGSVWTWGFADYQQLTGEPLPPGLVCPSSDGSFACSAVPLPVDMSRLGSGRVIAVQAGEYSSAVLTDSGEVRCWGLPAQCGQRFIDPAYGSIATPWRPSDNLVCSFKDDCAPSAPTVTVSAAAVVKAACAGSDRITVAFDYKVTPPAASSGRPMQLVFSASASATLVSCTPSKNTGRQLSGQISVVCSSGAFNPAAALEVRLTVEAFEQGCVRGSATGVAPVAISSCCSGRTVAYAAPSPTSPAKSKLRASLVKRAAAKSTAVGESTTCIQDVRCGSSSPVPAPFTSVTSGWLHQGLPMAGDLLAKAGSGCNTSSALKVGSYDITCVDQGAAGLALKFSLKMPRSASVQWQNFIASCTKPEAWLQQAAGGEAPTCPKRSPWAQASARVVGQPGDSVFWTSGWSTVVKKSTSGCSCGSLFWAVAALGEFAVVGGQCTA